MALDSGLCYFISFIVVHFTGIHINRVMTVIGVVSVLVVLPQDPDMVHRSRIPEANSPNHGNDKTNEDIEDIQEIADAPTHGKEQMLQTASGFLLILGHILGAVVQPILHALVI